MTPSSTCEVCGTVNVLLTGRCIACGQPMAGPPPPPPAKPAPGRSSSGTTGPTGPIAPTGPTSSAGSQRAAPVAPSFEDSATATTGENGETGADAAPSDEPSSEDRTIPVEKAVGARDAAAASALALEAPTSEIAAAPAPQVPAPQIPAAPVQAPPRPVVSRPSPAAADLDDSALRGTVVEQVVRPERAAPVAPPPASRASNNAGAPKGTALASESPHTNRGRTAEPTFLVRLLLPEGDKRAVEVGGEPMRIGSGLDEIGLSGDPRIRPGEGTLVVVDGKLWLDVDTASTGIFRRLDGEEELQDGDVVLIGDIAAEYRATPAAPALDAEAQVLGGASGSPCGRLVFLRRDGSAGPVHDLPHGKTILGRTDGHLNFPADSRLSRRHARFYAADGKVTVEDLDSRNGTYLRVRARRRLDTGDALRIGSAGVQIRSSG